MTKYPCPYCKNTYTQKYNYDRHIPCCEFFYKSKKAITEKIDLFDEKIPTQAEMFRLMQYMMVKIDKLEQENNLLKKLQKQKINILEWLNKSSNQLNITIQTWIKTEILPIVNMYLDVVFKTDLLTALKEVLEKTTATTKPIPICCFDNKQGVFYVFKKSNPNEAEQWHQIQNQEIDKYLSAIAHQFLLEFNNTWCAENEKKIETNEEYKEMYRMYYQKILGGEENLRNKRLREHLYKTMKQEIKSIREYEFG